MKSDLITEIDRQIAVHETELRKLRTARTALSGLNGTPASIPRGKSGGYLIKIPAKRAPAGHLESEMEKAIRAKPGQTNQQVRAVLTKAGYPYSLSPLHVGKRLSALVDDKRLRVALDGNLRRYHPAK